MENTSRFRRIVIVAPMRSHCETVRAIFENGPIETYLQRTRNDDLNRLKTLEKTFGIVAGTGVGKTVFLRKICEHHYGPNFPFTVVTKEIEATNATWQAPVLVCTTGIAMHYLQAGYITSEDSIIIDEVHQTSEHLEISMALAKYKGIPVSWMSATVDPKVYSDYFGTQELLHAEWKDPEKRAKIQIVRPGFERKPWIEQFMESNRFPDRVKDEKRGVAVFLPSRAMCEKYAEKYGKETEIAVNFYHGGESASKLTYYLRGEVKKPFILFMTAAGSSSLNVVGLDTVVIHDETYDRVINEATGVGVVQRVDLDNNKLLQMIGRVDGRVHGGEVYILTERDIRIETLKPEVPKFVLAGDLEQVALTCARCQIDLAELNPIGRINKQHYAKVRDTLVERGLISTDNRLTEYGQAVCRFPVPRVWAEHLVRAPNELKPFVTVIASCPTLYNMLVRDKGKHNFKEFKVENDDFLMKYRIVQFVIDSFTVVVRDQNDGGDRFQLRREFYEWAKEKGIYPRVIKDILLSIAAVCREMGVSLHAARREFTDVTEELSVAKLFKSMGVSAPALTGENADVKVSIGALLRQLYLEVGALTMSANGYTSDQKTHTECSDVSTCVGTGQVMLGLINARDTKYGVRYDLEGVALTIDDLRAHLDPSKRIIESVTTGCDAETFRISYRYSGFGFDTLVREEVEYEELPDDEPHLACVTKLVDAFASRLAALTMYLDEEETLSLEIADNNLKIVKAISEYKKALFLILNDNDPYTTFCYEAVPHIVATDVYKKMLAGTGIYTMTMAKKAGFDFRMSEALIPTEPLPEKPAPRPLPMPAYRAVEPRFGTNLGSLMNGAPVAIKHMNGSRATRPDPTVGVTSLASIKPMKTKAEIRKQQEREAREALKAELKTQWLDEPKGKTQARVDWLEAKAQELRDRIAAAEKKLAALRVADDQAAEKYNAEFANGDKGNAYSLWAKSSEAVKTANANLVELKKELMTKIDNMEIEALEIMEVLEAN